MTKENTKHLMGWLPDYPDFRDYTLEHNVITPMLHKIGIKNNVIKKIPAVVDLRKWCSPVEDQGELGSCTANAAIGLVEYYQKKAFNKHTDGSRLFLYKATRNLMHSTGDSGAFLRITMGAMVLFGVPPEEHWPYKIEDFEKEPPAFCYAFAQNYQAIKYVRLDPPGAAKNKLLTNIKTQLASGIPSMFGFTVYNSISQSSESGAIPYPNPGEKIIGGHAIVSIGYNDNLKIKNADKGGKETKGALLIRNSWGTGWGDKGYGWLPYDYVLNGLAEDWWCLLNNEWIDTGEFKVE